MNIKERLEAKKAEEAAKRQSLIARECYKAGHDSLAPLLAEAYSAVKRAVDDLESEFGAQSVSVNFSYLEDFIAKIDKEIP